MARLEKTEKQTQFRLFTLPNIDPDYLFGD
jgi:hypothetical protein